MAELKQRLRQKGFSALEITAAVTRLKKLNFLDDRRLAEEYASSLVRNRSFGRFRIERELKARRVDPRSVGPALKAAFEEVDEGALLERVLDQRMRNFPRPLTRARFYSLCQFLRRRGFPLDDIMKAVKARSELASIADEAKFEE